MYDLIFVFVHRVFKPERFENGSIFYHQVTGQDVNFYSVGARDLS